MAPTVPTVAPPMSITYAFNDRYFMKDLLNRVGISFTCITRLIKIENFETVRDLALTRVINLKATVQNVNKLFVFTK